MGCWNARGPGGRPADRAALPRHAPRGHPAALGADYAQVRGDGVITEQLAHDALTMIEIDDDGLDEMDKRLLEAMIYKFNGGPVGLSSLAVAVGEDASTLEDVHEPFLIMQGYISRTPPGGV